VAWDDQLAWLDGMWSQRVRDSYEKGFHGEDGPYAQALRDPFVILQFHTAFIDKAVPEHLRDASRDGLQIFLWQEYKLRFGKVFDWDAFREAYDHA